MFDDNSYGLVFTNRAIGLVFSGAMLYYTRPTWSKAVAYEYSLPAVTNMLSSWCQYEALKFVTFPTQVCVVLMNFVCIHRCFTKYVCPSAHCVNMSTYL